MTVSVVLGGAAKDKPVPYDFSLESEFRPMAYILVAAAQSLGAREHPAKLPLTP